nr:MAG TPA: hypothetical protein [Bacteriophage sp.]
MRTLKFNVKEQMIEKAKNCDFSDIARGTTGYLKAQFSFSSDWNGYAKIAVFNDAWDKVEECRPIIGNECEIPSKVLDSISFKVRIIGVSDGRRLTTNRTEVAQ